MTKLKIVSPTQNQTVLGDKVTVSFITGDFTVGQDGYIALWLDNPIEEASTAAKIAGQFDYTLSDLPAGLHRLTLEVVTRNNLPFNPRVKQTVSFTTTSVQIPTSTPSPTPFNMIFFVSVNWQTIALIAAAAIIAVGIFLKSTFGKPKIWK